MNIRLKVLLFISLMKDHQKSIQSSSKIGSKTIVKPIDLTSDLDFRF